MTGLTFSSDNYNEFKETGDKDLFERVVVDLILENNSKDVELSEYIISLSKRDKRIAVAATLGDNVLWNKLNDILNQNLSSYKRLQSVYSELVDYVKIADVERRQHGEILSPFKELAEPMIKLIDKYDPKFWKNKYNKVLDSSAGYGTFLILATYKFMEGLKDEIQNEEERFKWIVENCLYYGELQSKSVFSWLLAIDPYDEYKTNTYWGSFLTDAFDKHAKEVWGVEKFDLIIQNPPYQRRNPGDRKPFPLWDKFVAKSINLLNIDAYMIMVHPNGWRNIDGDFKYIQNLIRNKILYINMNSVQKGEQIFGASTSFDYYIIKLNDEQKITEVDDFDDQIEFVDISNMQIIPNSNIQLIQSFIAKENEEKIKVLYSRSLYGTDKSHMKREPDDTFKFSCVYSILKNGSINFFYSNKKERFFEPKVIFGNGANPTYYIDRKGEFGMTQFSFGVVGDIDIIEKVLSEKIDIINKITSATKFISTNGNPILYPKILSIFKEDFFVKINELK